VSVVQSPMAQFANVDTPRVFSLTRVSLQLLLAMKANVEDRGVKGDCTPLMEAASGGCVDIVKLLISHGADVNAQSSAGGSLLCVLK